VNNGDKFGGAWPDSGSQLEKSLLFLLFEKDPFLGHSLAEHLVFGLEELNLPTQFILSASCQMEQKRRKPTCHELISLITDIEKSDDNLFALLQSAARAYQIAERA
jgi:hypothetical protein